MTTLEDLYYGNISPCECDMKRGSQMDKLAEMIERVKAEIAEEKAKLKEGAV